MKCLASYSSASQLGYHWASLESSVLLLILVWASLQRMKWKIIQMMWERLGHYRMLLHLSAAVRGWVALRA